MKLIKYTLTLEGTIPEHIIEGGYLAISNNNVWPQNLTLVGVATDEALEESFADKSALLTYVNENNFVFKDIITKDVTPNGDIVDALWAKLK
jgi:hypothetical protein